MAVTFWQFLNLLLVSLVLPLSPAGAKDPTPASAPVPVAILDTPIDWDHELILPFFDRRTMDQLHTQDLKGHEINWFEANAIARKAIERKLRAGEYQEQVRYLEASSKLSDPSRPLTPQERDQAQTIVRDGDKLYENDPNWRKGIDALVDYQHGTHVAGLIVRKASPHQLKLIAYPYVGPAGRMVRQTPGLKDFLDPKAFLRKKFELYHQVTDRISQGIRKAGVKVVNVSAGQSREGLINAYRERSVWARQSFFERRLAEIAFKLAARIQSERQRLMLENPDVVFVLAAGNDGINLDTLDPNEWHTSQIQAHNRIIVGALDRQGHLAKFSEHGRNFVDVLALGTHVPSARANGGIAYETGTSFAAPIVTGEIAALRHEHPDWSAERTIREFLEHHTRSSPQFAHLVQGGRYLPFDPKFLVPPIDDKPSRTPLGCAKSFAAWFTRSPKKR